MAQLLGLDESSSLMGFGCLGARVFRDGYTTVISSQQLRVITVRCECLDRFPLESVPVLRGGIEDHDQTTSPAC